MKKLSDGVKMSRITKDIFRGNRRHQEQTWSVIAVIVNLGTFPRQGGKQLATLIRTIIVPTKSYFGNMSTIDIDLT